MSHMALKIYLDVMQDLVEFRLEEVPKLMKRLDSLLNNFKQPCFVKELNDTSDESRNATVKLSVQAYCSALRSGKLLRVLSKILSCLPATYYSSFLVEMKLVVENILVRRKLTDVNTLSAILDQSLATKLGLCNHFHMLTSLLYDLLAPGSHVTAETTPLVQDEQLQHCLVKLVIQVLRLFRQDVKSIFGSVCEYGGDDMRWKTITTTLTTLLMQSSNQDTVQLAGTALAMIFTCAPNVDMTQTACQGLLSVLSCEETCVEFSNMELKGQQCLCNTSTDSSISMFGIIRGLLVCSPMDTLSQGKNPILLQVLPYILQLCQGSNKHHFQAFSLLALWFQQLDASGLMYESSFVSAVLEVSPQTLISHYSFFSASVLPEDCTLKNKCRPSSQLAFMSRGTVILTKTLACIWPNWNSSVEGVTDLVVNIFHHLLRVWHKATRKGVCDCKELHEQLTSSVLSLAWHSKARYLSLKVLLAYVDFLQVIDIHRQLSCDLLRCMKLNNLASVVSDVYHTCVQQIINCLGQTQGLQTWRDLWMSTLVTGLASADKVQSVKMCTYWLPSTLKLLPGSHQLLCQSIEDSLKSAQDHCRQRWLFAWISVAVHARKLLHVPLHGLLASKLLQESLVCVDDDVRIEAFELVCTSLKKGETVSKVEVCFLQEFITANLKTDSAAVRQHMTCALKKMFVRIRDNCLIAIRNRQTQDSILAIGIQLIESLYQSLMNNLLPGSCYQRRQTSLAFLQTLLETLVYQPDSAPRKGMAPESSDSLLLYAQGQGLWQFFNQENSLILVCCLEDGVSEIQTQGYDLLLKYYKWPPLTARMLSPQKYEQSSHIVASHWTLPSSLLASALLADRTSADLFRRALHLMSSPKAHENHSGMLMISLLINRFIMEQSSSVSGEPCQLSMDTDFCTCSNSCAHQKHVVPGLILAVVDLLIDHMKTALNAAMDDLGTSIHIYSLHGVTQSVTRLMLDISDAMKHNLISLSEVHWKTRLEQIFSLNGNIITFVLDVLAGGENLERCPSFAEMAMALRSHISHGQELDDDVVSISSEFQLLLSWCWLNLKESCCSLGEMTSVFVASLGTSFHPVLMFSDVGQTFVKVLTTCRHRGAIEGSRHGLYRFCNSLLSSCALDLSQLPFRLLQQVLDSLTDNSLTSSVTRRSAGLPIIIQTVLQAAVRHSQKDIPPPLLLTSTVERLCDIARQQLPTEHSQLQDLSQGHALHILKTIFSDASLAAPLLPQLSQTTILVIQGFDSSSWAIRNAATQLISTLVNRIFGQKISDETSHSHMNLEAFSAHYPQLLQFLCENIAVTVAPGAVVRPSIYVILTLLSELGMSPQHQHSASCRNFLRESFMSLMSSPIFSLRKLAGQAYVALSPLDMVDATLTSILQKIGDKSMNMNELHGWLLCSHYLMSLGIISCDVSKWLLVFVLANDWLLTGRTSCLLPVSLVLQIIQLAVAKVPADIPLFEQLWKLVTICLENISTSQVQIQIGKDQCVKNCLQTFMAIYRASEDVKEVFTHQLSQLLLDQLASSSDHLSQVVLDCQHAIDVTVDKSIQRTVLVNMSQETDLSKLLTSAHFLLKLALTGDLQLEARDVLATGLTSHGPQQQAVTFIMCTISIGLSSSHSLLREHRDLLVEGWSQQLLAYSQPTQNEELRVLAARSLTVAGANLMRFYSAFRLPSLDIHLLSIIRASLQLLEDTELEVRRLVSRFLSETQNLKSVTFMWCYPALSKLVVDLCWSSHIVDAVCEVLYSSGQLATALGGTVNSNRHRVLFEPEATSALSERFVTQFWAYNTLEMMLTMSCGHVVYQKLCIQAMFARQDLSTHMDVIRINLHEFPVFNMSCHEDVVSSLLGVILLSNLYGKALQVFCEKGQDMDSSCLLELVQSLVTVKEDNLLSQTVINGLFQLIRPRKINQSLYIQA